MRSYLIASFALSLPACGGSTPAPAPAPASSAPPAQPAPATPPPDASPPPAAIDPTAMANAAKAFIAQVESSHQAIQHCYEQALRTNADLAGHPTELAVVALFDAHGANTSTSTTPALGGAFDACFAQVAAKWTVTVPAAMTFKANVTLTPQ